MASDWRKSRKTASPLRDLVRANWAAMPITQTPSLCVFSILTRADTQHDEPVRGQRALWHAAQRQERRKPAGLGARPGRPVHAMWHVGELRAGSVVAGSAFQDLPYPGNVLYEGMGKKRIPTELVPTEIDDTAYGAVLADVTDLLESARRAVARSVNSIMMATYWVVGRRVI